MEFFKTVGDNFKAAKDLFSSFTGEIIGATFHEDPSSYLDTDLAKEIRDKSKFMRIVGSDCLKDINEYKEKFKSTFPESKLIVTDKKITRVSGVFCKKGEEYKALISLSDAKEITGIVVEGDEAKVWFDYYKGFF